MAGQDLSRVDSLKNAVILVGNGPEKVDLLLELADMIKSASPEDAFQYTSNALQLSEAISYEDGALQAMIALSRIYDSKTELTRSIEYASKAREIAGRLDRQDYYAGSLLILVNGYRQLGAYAKSSELAFEALKIYEQTNDHVGQSNALYQIGGLYFQQHEYKKANDYNLKSLESAERASYQYGMARALASLGVTYGATGELDQAIHLLKRSNEMYIQTGNFPEMVSNFNNITQGFREKNQPDSALRYIRLAQEANKKLGSNRNSAYIYFHLGHYYASVGDEEKFLQYIRKAYDVGKKTDILTIQLEAAEILRNIYNNCNLDSAYKYLDLLYVLSDSLNSQDLITRLARQEFLYELEKEEQERIFRAKRKDLTNIVLILGLISGFIFILLILLRYRILVKYSRLRQQYLTDELDFKNRELTTHLVTLMRRNEMIEDIREKLLKMKKNAVREETRTTLTNIVKELRDITQARVWEEFEKRFKEVHSAFYENLNRVFPDLTPNEQRLCAFLKLNMSTKEISSISGQSSRAIEMARFRLRKKMGIVNNRDVNLITFISRI